MEHRVRVVLQQQDVLLLGQVDQPSPVGLRHADPAGVGEVGHHVAGPGAQPLGPGATDLFGEVGQVDAARPLAYRADRHLDQPGRAEEADVRGVRREDHVAGVGAQRPEDQDHRLLAPGGHQHGLGGDGQSFVGLQVPGDQLVDESLGAAVLEEGPPHVLVAEALIVRQVPLEGAEMVAEPGDVVEALVRASRREGDGVRIAARDLVEQRHGGQRRVTHRSVQPGGVELDAGAASPRSTGELLRSSETLVI